MKKKTRKDILYGKVEGSKKKAFDSIYKAILPKLVMQYDLPLECVKEFFTYGLGQDSVRNKQIVRNAFKNKVYDKYKRKGEFKCIKCGCEDDLTLHHVRTRNLFPEDYWSVGNVVLLCEDCHKLEHNLVPKKDKKSLKELDE